MSSKTHSISSDGLDLESSHATQEFVTMKVCGQLFGIPVLTVQDVLGAQNIARIPLAPKEVAGSLNLRGRIVTAIDMRLRLGQSPRGEDEGCMSIVVEHQHELYSLLVDEVGDVLSLPDSDFERNPTTLDPKWRAFSVGLYRLEEELLLVLDVAKVLELRVADAA